MTGAELLQADRDFAVGYISGVVEYRVTVLNSEDATFMQVRNCVMQSKINADTMYKTVTEHIGSHPETLSYPAVGAIIDVLARMCVR